MSNAREIMQRVNENVANASEERERQRLQDEQQRAERARLGQEENSRRMKHLVERLTEEGVLALFEEIVKEKLLMIDPEPQYRKVMVNDPDQGILDTLFNGKRRVYVDKKVRDPRPAEIEYVSGEYPKVRIKFDGRKQIVWVGYGLQSDREIETDYTYLTATLDDEDRVVLSINYKGSIGISEPVNNNLDEVILNLLSQYRSYLINHKETNIWEGADPNGIWT